MIALAVVGLIIVVGRLVPSSMDTTTIHRPIIRVIILLSITEHVPLVMVTNFVECSRDSMKDTIRAGQSYDQAAERRMNPVDCRE